MNFYGATIATKRHPSQSQGVHKIKCLLLILKYTITNMIFTLYMSFLLSGIEFKSNVQLTLTFVLKENQRTYSVSTTKQQRKKIQKNTLKLSFDLF